MVNPMASGSEQQKADLSETQKAQMTGCYSETQTGQCSVIRLVQQKGSRLAHSKERSKDVH